MWLTTQHQENQKKFSVPKTRYYIGIIVELFRLSKNYIIFLNAKILEL
jgi:hypothetical protein